MVDGAQQQKVTEIALVLMLIELASLMLPSARFTAKYHCMHDVCCPLEWLKRRHFHLSIT